MAGLYLHIPFCHQKCEYCDFYSLTQLEQIDAFVEALLTELRLRADMASATHFDTIFLGGGTPSLLNAGQLERIWQTLHQHYHIDPDGEFSLESNPGTLDLAKLQHMKSLGFNRLSMGVQSFNPAELSALGRIHSVDEVYDNFENARAAGFENINLDLMTAFPGITPDSFQHSLNEIIRLRPEHISCYTLIFEPNTILYKRMLRGETGPLSNDEEAGYYEIAREFLGSAGYEQYEISNFSRGKQMRCRHNLIYWQHLPYLGFGPSAHSFWDQRRFANKRSLMVYLQKLKAGELPLDFSETLSENDLMFEYIFLNLRLKDGVDLQVFRERFGQEIDQQYGEVLRELQQKDLIELGETHLRLSKQGWMVADDVAAYF